MELNADLEKPAMMHGSALPWVPSPVHGIERRMLARSGGEKAIATSIVRYSSRSAFSPHAHPGGEEFLVLEGVFEDEVGQYPSGTYVRNPPGSRHAPRSKLGCVLFVKLMQLRTDDLQRVVVRPHSAFGWPRMTPGTGTRDLFSGRDEHVELAAWGDSAIVQIDNNDGLELLVLSGSMAAYGVNFTAQGWLRLPPREPLKAVVGPEGCAVWLKLKRSTAREFGVLGAVDGAIKNRGVNG